MFARMTLLVAALALLALAVPSATFAQSAGDDQYTDPFGQVDENSGGGGDGTGGGDGDTTVQAEPAPAPTPVEPSQTGEETVAQPAGESLPRTGLPAAALALIGAVCLAAGAGLRSRL